VRDKHKPTSEYAQFFKTES